jgi:acetylornithine deacetylase
MLENGAPSQAVVTSFRYPLSSLNAPELELGLMALDTASLDVVELTKSLIAFDSVSKNSNAEISDFIANILERCRFTVERLEFIDENNQRKVSLVAKKGAGEGGLGLFSHSDTVPGDAGWEPFHPTIDGERLVGRGACDMKGPLAATLLATAGIEPGSLRAPLYIVVTADEEIGYPGAKQVVAESQFLAAGWPAYAVVAEPTHMQPVYAHKGGARVFITAYGRAAHTSTDLGVSANFLIAPFLAEMAELAKLFRTDSRFMNHEFSPPTNGFNMVLDDGGCKANVTAAKTVCTLGLRMMPNDHREEALGLIFDAAKRHNLEVSHSYRLEPFYVDRNADIVRAAAEVTGLDPITVPFGTEASLYKEHTQCVILGPGSIEQAHTVGEWIHIQQLHSAVNTYRKLIDRFCT